ncbi:MAG: 50S ribosomal protein L31e [Candidatus Odinarchaeia archaeon]
MSIEKGTSFLDTDIAEERVYTVPFRDVKKVPRNKRSNKAIRILKEFMIRHMKSEEIIINPKVNEKIWERGIEKPPNKIKVKAIKSRDGVVEVLLAEE